MKKLAMLVMSFIFLGVGVGSALAEQEGTPRYEELKALKVKQREERATVEGVVERHDR